VPGPPFQPGGPVEGTLTVEVPIDDSTDPERKEEEKSGLYATQASSSSDGKDGESESDDPT
jgi:hypothetical protein